MGAGADRSKEKPFRWFTEKWKREARPVEEASLPSCAVPQKRGGRKPSLGWSGRIALLSGPEFLSQASFWGGPPPAESRFSWAESAGGRGNGGRETGTDDLQIFFSIISIVGTGSKFPELAEGAFLKVKNILLYGLWFTPASTGHRQTAWVTGEG